MSESPIDWEESYKEWLSTGITDARIIETMEIAHPSFTSLFVVNSEQVETLPLADQGGTLQDFSAARFVLDPTPVNQSTEQQTQVLVSSLEGNIYRELKNMTMAERADGMSITVRLYLSSDKTVQLVDPPPIWTVHSVSLNQSVVRLNLRNQPLRVRRIGRYYTALEFPVLRISR